MNIGIIGAGNVGGTLGRRWASNGHNITFSTRDGKADSIKDLLSESGPNAKAASVADAAKSSDVVLLAVPPSAVQDAIRSAANLSGKILIDATNPLLPGLAGLAHGTTTSGAEQVAQWAVGAKVVKAFNTVGANIMANPHFDSGKVGMFYCGDDAPAKQIVRGLIEELGFDALDAGGLSQARLIEPFALLWITLAMKHGYGRGIGFELLRRPNA